jgi:large repetitive protein
MRKETVRFLQGTLAAFLNLSLLAAQAKGESVTLAWDPNQEPDIAAYIVYWGTGSRNYPWNHDVGTQTTYPVLGLQAGQKYFFAVKAKNGAGQFSDYSAEISYTVPSTPNQPPIVTAAATLTSGPAPLTVSFTGSATDPDGSILGYAWTFGDGTGSILQNPSHTYSSAGSYTARLTVTDDRSGTSSAAIQIVVQPSGTAPNQPPTASVSATPSMGHVPLSVSFTGSGTDPDGTIVAYSWNFGDGTSSAQQSPTKTYSAQGTYTAALTVTDNKGATGSRSAQITVLPANALPVVTAAASPTKGSPPLTVSFTAQATDGDGAIASYRWNFGDGTTSSAPNVNHVYSIRGTYRAVLTVTDDDGASASKSFSIRVGASLSAPKSLQIAGPK